MMDEERSLNCEGARGNARGNFVRDMIIVDFKYITMSWIGRVKLLQFIFVTLAGIILPSVNGVFFARYAFFVFIVWTSFIYIVLDLLLHLTSLWRRLPKMMTSDAILIFPLLLGCLAFLIGSSVIASAANAPGQSVYQGSTATTTVIAALCGFIAMILYAVEVFLRFRRLNGGNGTTEAQATNPARNRPISHPVTIEIVDPDPPPYKENDSGRGGGAGGAFVAPVTTFS